jgi:Zn-dependent protease
VNLLLALVSLTIYGIWIRITHESAHAGTAKHVQLFLLEMGSLNIVLLLFNLLPVPPLDGSSVLGSFSPDFHRAATNPANRGVFMGVFLLVFFFSGSIFTLADGVVASFLQLFGLTVG